MKTRPWRLRTQISLLVLGVIVVAQAVSLWFFVDERTLAVQAAIGAEAAGRAANVAQRCCHVNSPNLQVGKLFVDQAACAADFHASNASSRW